MQENELIQRLKEQWHEGFGDDSEFIDDFFAAYDRPSNRFVAFRDDMPVAQLHALNCGDSAYIYGVTTARAYRGRGIARALITETLDTLHNRGISTAFLLVEEPSLRHWYASMGFITSPAGPITVTGYDGTNLDMEDPALNTPMYRPTAFPTDANPSDAKPPVGDIKVTV